MESNPEIVEVWPTGYDFYWKDNTFAPTKSVALTAKELDAYYSNSLYKGISFCLILNIQYY